MVAELAEVYLWVVIILVLEALEMQVMIVIIKNLWAGTFRLFKKIKICQDHGNRRKDPDQGRGKTNMYRFT